MARGSRKRKLADLPSEPDARAELDSALFLGAAAPVLAQLKADLAARAKASPAVTGALEARHAADKAARKTADSFAQWRGRFIEQVAAAWLLSAVFVRTLEDRGLLEQARIAGAGALDSQQLFFEMAPSLSERDYLLTVFRELSRLPAAAPLFDARHNPVWLLAPSAEAAKALLALFRAPDPAAPAFRFGQPDTRFLGDLYQDLDEGVRKRFALLQTPRFVESFILDRTLERALERFGLSDTTLIDPTCGSGHFLLGAFQRLYAHHRREAPGLAPREAAHLALDAIYGADINPYAVAIARFRLTLAFVDTAGYPRLRDAPALPLHLAVADSLLHNPQLEQATFAEVEGQSAAQWHGAEYALEDEAAARDVLHRRYAAVVGNPPYINVKDAALRKRYAKAYPSCHMNYALTVPFVERFFQLAREGGAVGQITANSFMKREFGKKLIEEFLPTVNLDLIVNTSGAYIPGHGTPTVLLFGTAEPPHGDEVHAVLAKRGEPNTPADPEEGLVWRSIAGHFGEDGFEDDYISVATINRSTILKHPWSLSGGGASELKELLESRAEATLRDVIDDVGFSVIIGEDEVFIRPAGHLQWSSLPRIPLVIGEQVRDWSLSTDLEILRPFDSETLEVTESPELLKHLWPWRRILEGRIVSGSTSMKEAGKSWFDVRRLSRDKHRVPLSIAFAFVATHNHFVLDRGGKVFKQSAPIIKLPDTATEDDHYALLAYLNSSTACFWMKQVFFDKGNRGEGGGVTAELWEKFYEFDGTKLRALPLPPWTQEQRAQAIDMGKHLSAIAERRAKAADFSPLFEIHHGQDALEEAIKARTQELTQLEHRLRALQERLDWWIYSTFHLCDPTLATGPEALEPGARACDVLYARRAMAGDATARYFELCRLPPARRLADPTWASRWALEGRLAAIDRSAELRVLESPVFKRTFREGFRPPDVAAQAEAFLSRQLETSFASHALPVSGTVLAAQLAHWPPSFGDPHAALIANGIPYLSSMRFTPAALEKRSSWLRCWELQRREDEGESVDPIPIPPKYKPTDFRSPTYFRLRGKLDVPKERFISYPGCESDEDGEPLYGWAGWNHLQRAQALAALYQERKNDGWQADRLTPMLAGLLELVPWVKQWHNDPSEEYGGLRLGDYFEGFIAGECSALGLTEDDLTSWRPADKKARSRRTKP